MKLFGKLLKCNKHVFRGSLYIYKVHIKTVYRCFSIQLLYRIHDQSRKMLTYVRYMYFKGASFLKCLYFRWNTQFLRKETYMLNFVVYFILVYLVQNMTSCQYTKIMNRKILMKSNILFFTGHYVNSIYFQQICK